MDTSVFRRYLIVLLFGISTNVMFPQGPINKAISLYMHMQYTEAITEFNNILKANPNDVKALTYCAETYRRTNSLDDAITYARRALAIEPCNTMAMTTIADSYNPQYGGKGPGYDTTWHYLIRAEKCNDMDGNMLTALWVMAQMSKSRETEEKSLQNMISSQFLTPSILAYNRWVLEALHEKCILITNGDFDTYPPLALQAANKIRADIAVINISLLNMPWYAKLMCERFNLSLEKSIDDLSESYPRYSDDSTRVILLAEAVLDNIMRGIKKGIINRPLAFASTCDEGLRSGYSKNLTHIGPAYLFSPEPVENDNATDWTEVENNLNKIKAADFTAPCVSDQDRSPVRHQYPYGMHNNIVSLAVQFIYHCEAEHQTEKSLKYRKMFKAFVEGTIPEDQWDFSGDVEELLGLVE